MAPRKPIGMGRIPQAVPQVVVEGLEDLRAGLMEYELVLRMIGQRKAAEHLKQAGIDIITALEEADRQ